MRDSVLHPRKAVWSGAGRADGGGRGASRGEEPGDLPKADGGRGRVRLARAFSGRDRSVQREFARPCSSSAGSEVGSPTACRPHTLPRAHPCLIPLPMLARKAVRMSNRTLAASQRTRAIAQHMHASTDAAAAPKPRTGNEDEVRTHHRSCLTRCSPRNVAGTRPL